MDAFWHLVGQLAIGAFVGITVAAVATWLLIGAVQRRVARLNRDLDAIRREFPVEEELVRNRGVELEALEKAAVSLGGDIKRVKAALAEATQQPPTPELTRRIVELKTEADRLNSVRESTIEALLRIEAEATDANRRIAQSRQAIAELRRASEVLQKFVRWFSFLGGLVEPGGPPRSTPRE